MTYIENLDANKKEYKNYIDDLALKYKIQFVGSGYFELIIPSASVEKVISEFTQKGIVISILVWWCHCTEENEQKYGCPHGYGGPYSDYFSGWFSEMGIQAFEISEELLQSVNEYPYEEKIKEINGRVWHAISKIHENEHYSPCLVPALGLYVPEHW